MTAPIENILQRLTKVSSGAEGQWMACCPAHEDKTPSLAVREAPDGAVLLRCFGGCTVHAVVAALGLNMAELFPPREPRHGAPKRLARTLTAYQALELLDNEAVFVAVAAGNLRRGLKLNDADYARLLKSVGRIGHIRREAQR